MSRSCWSPSQAARDASRPRGALLTYTWGTSTRACMSYFFRSFGLLNTTRTDIYVLWEGVRPCASEPAPSGVHFVEVPTEVLADCQATGLPPVSYRHVAFRWWLRQARNTATYRYAGIIDTDLIFQLDPFSVMHPFVRTEHELHVISENPVLHNGGFTTERLSKRMDCKLSSNATFGLREQSWGQPVGCATRLVPSRAAAIGAFWAAFGQSYSFNVGTVFGTLSGVRRFVEADVEALVGWGKGCWEQGVAQVVLWTGAAKASRVVLWGWYDGFVKTLDVGTVRDRQGRFYNEQGALFAMVHQFKKKRNPWLMRELRHMYPDPGKGPPLTDKLFKKQRSRQYHYDFLHAVRRRKGLSVGKDGTTGGQNQHIGLKRRQFLTHVDQMRLVGLPIPEDQSVPLPPPLPACASPETQYRVCATFGPEGAAPGPGINCSNAHRPWELMREAGFWCGAS